MSVVLINYISETFGPTRGGAISTWTWEMCQRAAEQGLEPTVITRNNDAEHYPWSKTIRVDYPDLDRAHVGRVLRKLDHMWAEYSRRLHSWNHVKLKGWSDRVADAIEKAEIAHFPFFLSNDPELAVYLRRRFPKARIHLHCQNHHPCKPRFQRLVGSAVNSISAVSGHCAGWNKAFYNVEFVDTLWNGVNTELFHPADEPLPGPPLINYTGRIDQTKGVDLILKAAKKLSARTTNFRIQIVGSSHFGFNQRDGYQDELDRLVADVESSGISVKRLGYVARGGVPEALRQCHIHVVPSRWDEPCALSILEGMASGLAVIGSRTGGTPEIIGDSGLLFNRNDADQLAEHLGLLVQNEQVRREFARKARQRALQFTWQATWDGLRRLVKI